MSDNQNKLCNRCQIEKTIDKFPKRGSVCKDCQNARKRERRAEVKEKYEAENPKEIKTTRTCSVCKVEKNLTEFAKGQYQCKSCFNQKAREKKAQNDPNYRSRLNPSNEKTCKICGQTKDIKYFVDKRLTCKDCWHIQLKEYRNTTIENQVNKIPQPGETKKCPGCNLIKPLDQYHKGQYRCIDCKKKERQESKASKQAIKNALKPEVKDGFKICSYCKDELPISDFYNTGSMCIECSKAYSQKKTIENKEKEKERDPNKLVYCSSCENWQPETMFRIGRKKCLDCEREYGRKYRKSDVGKAKSKEWLQNNQEKMTKLQARWHQINKERLNAKFRDKYLNNKYFRMNVLMKSKINGILSYDLGIKTGRSYKMLGCSAKMFKEWINFCKNKSKEKVDDWHIDHVRPIKLNDYDNPDEMLDCWNWKNLSPLSAKANMTKKALIDKNQIKNHLRNLIEFHTLKKMKFDHSYIEKMFLPYLETNKIDLSEFDIDYYDMMSEESIQDIDIKDENLYDDEIDNYFDSIKLESLKQIINE